MTYAPRYSTVLIAVVLLAFVVATFGSVDAQTGKIEVLWLSAIDPGDKLTFP
jgi:hypothetical protein